MVISSKNIEVLRVVEASLDEAEATAKKLAVLVDAVEAFLSFENPGGVVRSHLVVALSFAMED